MDINTVVALIAGLALIVVMLVIALFIPNPSKFQYTIFRIIISVSIAAFAVIIPGFLELNWNGYIKAGGAFAVFIIVYFNNPASLIVKKK